MHIKLLAALNRPTTSGGISTANVSKDKAYAVYGVETGVNTIVAELFRITKHNVTSIRSVAGDFEYNRVYGGRANSLFNRFTLLQAAPTNKARIRVLDTELTVLNERIFDDYVSSTNSLRGGYFSPDGHFIVLSYVDDSDLTIIRVINSFTLQDYANIRLAGIVTEVKFLYDRTIILSNAQGTFATPTAPFTLRTYRVASNALSLINSVFIPQVDKIHFRKDDIYVGTALALVPDQLSIYTFGPTSGLDTDGAELRLYRGEKLELIATRNLDYNVNAVPYTDEDTILLAQSLPGQGEFFVFARTDDRLGLDVRTVPKADLRNVSSAVSEKILFRVGDSQVGLNNVLFYQIKVENHCSEPKLGTTKPLGIPTLVKAIPRTSVPKILLTDGSKDKRKKK